MRNRGWTDAEIAFARAKHAEGWHKADIGKALGRTENAVKFILKRKVGEYGCLSQAQFNDDAVRGSERLLHALLRLAA